MKLSTNILIILIGIILFLLNTSLGMALTIYQSFNVLLNNAIIMGTTALIYIVIHMKINNTFKISLPFSLSACGIIQFIAGLFAPARFIDNYWLIAIVILFIFEIICLTIIRQMSN